MHILGTTTRTATSLSFIKYTGQHTSTTTATSSRALQSFHQSIGTGSRHQAQSSSTTDPDDTNMTATASTTITDTIMNNENYKSNNVKTFHILCLHGKGDNGPRFEEKLEPLEQLLQESCIKSHDNHIQFKFDYLTAPFAMNQDNDDDDDDGSRQWWTLPPGVRSFTASEYQGFTTAKELIQKQLDNQINTTQGSPYHFILGHSQGAILLSALLATDQHIFRYTTTTTSSSSSSSSSSTSDSYDNSGENRSDDSNDVKIEGCLGYIFNGCAWPNPYTNELNEFQTTPAPATATTTSSIQQEKSLSSSSSPEALFIIGQRDKINPPESALRVKDVLQKGGLNVSIINHDGGHSVPVHDSEALEGIASWILDCVVAQKNTSVQEKNEG